MPQHRISVATVGILALLAPSASAQAVAFQPVVAPFPNGVSLSATPAVSVDRRYVRLGVNPVFTALEGFATFPVPAAVSGVGAGGLGGGGAGAGALRGEFVTLGGLDGPISPVPPSDPLFTGSFSPDPFESATGDITPPQRQQPRTKAPRVPSSAKRKQRGTSPRRDRAGSGGRN
jgi:hypothetical protein